MNRKRIFYEEGTKVGTTLTVKDHFTEDQIKFVIKALKRMLDCGAWNDEKVMRLKKNE